jgi:hypothetical protein
MQQLALFCKTRLWFQARGTNIRCSCGSRESEHYRQGYHLPELGFLSHLAALPMASGLMGSSPEHPSHTSKYFKVTFMIADASSFFGSVLQKFKNRKHRRESRAWWIM